jgi:hypothetical protein
VKKNSVLYLTLIAVFVFIFLFPSKAKASCYYPDNSGYNTCVGNVYGGKNFMCPKSGAPYYACCNETTDTCPSQQGAPGESPIPPNPSADSTCGGTSQICCSGNTCDTSSLTCYTTVGGKKCLSQAQIKALPNGEDTNPTVSAQYPILCDGETGISTAIGCIHALGDQNTFLSDLLKWATGIGGGIAFVLMLYAGFMIMTASGNPERLKAGQELLTSAIAGLILLIFSVFILKFIGIDILGLDKFGFGSSS